MTTTATAASEHRLDVLESRFALRVASRLGEAADTVQPDVGERLRFARDKALARARAKAAEAAPVVVGRHAGGAAVLGGPPARWFKLAGLVPLVALLVGLLLIGEWHASQQVDAAAEIDAAILADEVPPRAYSDPGFVEFLKTPRERE